MQFSVYQQSHIGGRKVNQDRMGYSYTREALLLVLADGMGGHQRGEVAASIALQTMSTLFRSQANPYVKKPEHFLEDAFEQAHEAIQRYAREHGMPDNPRTTIVACLVQHNCAVWAHCGDSRLYWLRRGQILARTRDHSHIEHLIAKGLADPSERNSHPDRNKLYSCLGASTPPKVELSRQSSLEPGDVLLLCSDGLWGILPDTEIVHQLSTHTIVQAVPDMIGMATAIGGPRGDNVTALAIQWQGANDAAAAGDDSTISTLMLPEGEVTTRLAEQPAAAHSGDPGEEDFGDEDIEKAIAEIRDAIEKSSQLLK
jgi:serine/threonine protein phosphatase PrpC